MIYLVLNFILSGVLVWFSSFEDVRNDDERVKPIINLKVIDQYQIAYEAFTKSDLLCILGYSINTDDEHIKNFIRERLAMEKKVVLFLYSKGSDSSEEEKSYEKMFESNPCLEILPIRSTEDFCTSLEKLLKDL